MGKWSFVNVLFELKLNTISFSDSLVVIFILIRKTRRHDVVETVKKKKNDMTSSTTTAGTSGVINLSLVKTSRVQCRCEELRKCIHAHVFYGLHTLGKNKMRPPVFKIFSHHDEFVFRKILENLDDLSSNSIKLYSSTYTSTYIERVE